MDHVTFGWRTVPMPQRAPLLFLLVALLSSSAALAQNGPPPRGPNPPPPNANGPNVNGPNAGATDPGVRSGAVDAGGPLADLDTPQWNFFAAAREVFGEVTSV